MASRLAGSAGLVLLKLDLHHPSAKGDFAAHMVWLDGRVLRVAGATGAPLLAVDVQVVQVAVAVAESGRRGAFVPHDRAVMALGAEVVGAFLVRRIEVLGERLGEDRGDVRAVRLVAGDAVLLTDGAVEEAGAGDLRSDVVYGDVILVD